MQQSATDRHDRLRPRLAYMALAGCMVLLFTACTPTAGTSSPPPTNPSSSEHAFELVVDCMTDRGWEVEVNSAGDGFQVDVPAAQQDIYASDTSECGELAVPNYDAMTDAQWRDWYGMAMDSAECLTDAGFSVVDQPTLQRFISEGGWSPYDQLVLSGTLTGPRLNEVSEACPQPVYYPG